MFLYGVYKYITHCAFYTTDAPVPAKLMHHSRVISNKKNTLVHYKNNDAPGCTVALKNCAPWQCYF
jgi:hypothetical protein